MADYVLYHHGVKGMKWGVRRYQNKDGSLTAIGRKRQIQGASDDKRFNVDLERSKKVVDAGSNLTNQLKQVNDRNLRKSSKTKMDLSSMTDKQMRDEINRALLEKQYNDMFAPQKTSKGREYASKILEGVGGALAITSSALGVALAIKELRK